MMTWLFVCIVVWLVCGILNVGLDRADSWNIIQRGVSLGEYTYEQASEFVCGKTHIDRGWEIALVFAGPIGLVAEILTRDLPDEHDAIYPRKLMWRLDRELFNKVVDTAGKK